MKKIICLLGMISVLAVVPIDATQAQTTRTKVKKGMSHKAKGAIVGGIVGGVAGGVLNKKHRVGGAAVGTAVGAGTGYLIGKHVDKKHPNRKVKTKTVTK